MDKNIPKHLLSKDKKTNQEIKKTAFLNKQSQRFSKLNSLFAQEKSGYLEAEDNEKTLQFRQKDLKPLIPIQNAQQIFDLDLEWGQYKIDYFRNGNYLAMGSNKGHITMLDWKRKNLKCEFNVQEKIYDIKFLQNWNTLAVAQQKYVYIYDDSGVELHKLSSHLEPAHLEYLPYHFLLASASRLGFLKYHDVSTGKIVAEYRTKIRDPCCLKQDPHNGIMCIGDNKGRVTMYSPNTSEPLTTILCHKSNVSTVNVHPNGHNFVTTSNDGTWKVWDNRTYKMIYDYWSPSVVQNSDLSQRGLLSITMNKQCQIWKDWYKSKEKNPYMKYESKKTITDCQFVPFEDFMGVGQDGGFSSIIVPGAGEAQLDSFEANPFKTKKQEQEDLVHKLLEKIPYQTIALNPNVVGTIDRASKEVIEREEKLEQEEKLAKQTKKKRRKMRGRQKSGRIETAKEIEKDKKEFEKRNQHVNILIRQRNAEKIKKSNQIETLKQLDEITDFDPLSIIAKSKKIAKNKGKQQQQQQQQQYNSDSDSE